MMNIAISVASASVLIFMHYCLSSICVVCTDGLLASLLPRAVLHENQKSEKIAVIQSHCSLMVFYSGEDLLQDCPVHLLPAHDRRGLLHSVSTVLYSTRLIIQPQHLLHTPVCITFRLQV